MREVRRKTSDEAVNQLLVDAQAKNVKLSWDRAEAQQPQCGFGRLCLCCNDCFEGPCRVNPFGQGDELTICGRSKDEIVAGAIISAAADGLASLAELASERGVPAQVISNAKDNMIHFNSLEDTLNLIGKEAAVMLKGMAVDAAQTVSVGIGSLAEDKPNVVIVGHVSPKAAAGLKSDKVVLSGLAGSEGLNDVNALTGYDAQEAVLLTGAVDALVIGDQCVMPGLVKLAKSLDIAVFGSGDDAKEVLEAAEKAFAARKSVVLPETKAAAKVSTLADVKAIAGDGSKLLYVGGCGHYRHTQDEEAVKLAKSFIERGYSIVAGGCIGMSLAKAGLPADRFAYIGACTNAGLALELCGSAVFMQATHHKTVAEALAFAATGAKTYLDVPAFFENEQAAEALKKFNVFPL